MLISLIMQIAQSMQISIRHFRNPQTMHITFQLKKLAVKNISGLTHCRYSSGKWTTAKSVAPSVKLSSVITTTRRTTDIQRRNTLNDQLRANCEENNATFVDNDNNFTFRNGAVDNAAFANDGLHLSNSGVDRLLSNLGLPPRSSVRNKRQQQNRRPAAPRTPSRDTPNNNNNNNAGTSDHEWSVIERRNRHRLTMGKFANCSETNHVTANSKHHKQVQCRQCGERGHKEKHHTRN